MTVVPPQSPRGAALADPNTEDLSPFFDESWDDVAQPQQRMQSEPAGFFGCDVSSQLSCYKGLEAKTSQHWRSKS